VQKKRKDANTYLYVLKTCEQDKQKKLVKTINKTKISAYPTLKIRSESFKLNKIKTTPTSHLPTYQTTQTIIKPYTLKVIEERDLALQHWRDPTITLSTGAFCAPNSSARTPTTTSATPINTHSTVPFRNQHHNCSNYSSNNYSLLCFKADMLFFSKYYNAHNLNTRSNNNKQNSILSPKPTKLRTSPRQSVSKQFQRSLK